MWEKKKKDTIREKEKKRLSGGSVAKIDAAGQGPTKYLAAYNHAWTYGLLPTKYTLKNSKFHVLKLRSNCIFSLGIFFFISHILLFDFDTSVPTKLGLCLRSAIRACCWGQGWGLQGQDVGCLGKNWGLWGLYWGLWGQVWGSWAKIKADRTRTRGSWAQIENQNILKKWFSMVQSPAF